MEIPVWTTPALAGAAVGAIAVAFVGFSWGGWVTGSTAAEMAETQSSSAVVTALTPYCLEKSRMDPNVASVLDRLNKASSFQRRGIVEEAGWATPPGSDGPNSRLAQSCQMALVEES